MMSHSNHSERDVAFHITRSNITIKEDADGEFYSWGFVATTHPDRARDDEVSGEILSKQALKQIVDMINQSENSGMETGSGNARATSYRHDWIHANDPTATPQGMVVPGSAELKQLDDGHWGVHVKIHHNKNHPQFKNIVYEIEHGYIPGYSIEYRPGTSRTVSMKGKVYRFVESIKDYVGQAFASARLIANPHALITGFAYKELEAQVKEEDKPINKPFRLPKGSSKKFGVYVKKGDKVVKVTFGDPDMEIKRDDLEARKNFRARHNCDSATDKTSAKYWSCRMWEKGTTVSDLTDKQIEQFDELFGINSKEEILLTQEETQTVKEAPAPEEAPPPEPEAEALDAVEEKETESNVPQIDVKEIASKIRETPEFKEAISTLTVEKKTLKQTEEDTMTDLKVKEMNDALSGLRSASIGQRDSYLADYKEAALVHYKESGKFDALMKQLNSVGRAVFTPSLHVKCVGKGLKIVGGVSTKDTLGLDSNTSSYTQSDVEFADLFAPGIIDTFNNQTNLFGFLNKEQHIGGEFYQWKMITSKDPNSTGTFVDRNDTTVVKNFSNKENYQTPLKIARRGVSVTDFINRYAAASLGDLFRLELDLQMKEMMNDVNAALFAEVADGTNASPLGLEAVADSAGNTTLYGKTRTAANRLAPNTAANTYEAIGGSLTEARLRQSISYLETEGSKRGDLAFITSPTSRDYILNLLDGQRRFNTTEAAFGFNTETVFTYDGIPVIVDSDCNTDAIYLIDRAADVIVVAMEPRIVELAKVGAAMEAYVQMDFAHVYKQPRRISMLDTLSA